MKGLYASPLRVYVLLGALAAAGIFSASKLPVSLFPNSSKPTVRVFIAYGGQTPDEFLHGFGAQLEGQLRAISQKHTQVEEVYATYEAQAVEYGVRFVWGVSPDEAKREVQNIVDSFAARLSAESRDSVEVNIWDRNSGFFAMSFYSTSRSLGDLYDYLEPILTPKLANIQDARQPALWNPEEEEIRIELNREAMSPMQLYPRDVEQAISHALSAFAAGVLSQGISQYTIQMPRGAATPEDLGLVLLRTPSGRLIHLSEIARIERATKTLHTTVFKTSGISSLLLFSSPKPGGNVKKMSEDILRVVEEVQGNFPSDIHYKVLVDPSEFIRSAVSNVLKEVGIAALLAVLVLFVFIGSVRNVITAAIEIPLSMVLAFILMRFSGMNLNLISLAGLALSAGMNVDGSVVVMENIFRHFELHKGPIDATTRVRIVGEAVKEVWLPILASTVASLVVFVPLAFTSDLTFAVLGDLALAVIFSHGFSAIVALLLVPTVRLQLMSHGDVSTVRSPIEGMLTKLEHLYVKTLRWLFQSPRARSLGYATLTLFLSGLIFFVLPRLPKEILGKPDTDWVMVGIDTQGNSAIRQMETLADDLERQLFATFGNDIQYTFTQLWSPNGGVVMARLKDKHQMMTIRKALETTFINSPTQRYWVEPWNPSELPIPNPPDLIVSVRGGSDVKRAEYATEINELLQETKIFSRVANEPPSEKQWGLFLNPRMEYWSHLRLTEARLTPADLADLTRVATTGKRIAFFPTKNKTADVVLRYQLLSINHVEDLSSFPVGIGSKLIPLRAIADVSLRVAPPTIYREDGRELFMVKARIGLEEKSQASAGKEKAHREIERWIGEKQKEKMPAADRPTVLFEDADKDLNHAISQLTLAVGISLALIFLTMLFQFGSVMESLIVMVSVPLGSIGVLASLALFHSTLSLNSILGVILLNGIAVANGILLVDFIRRQYEEGMSPADAGAQGASKRLRPILITSLTSILGMLPVAFGFGEGGRILQPLGIAVSGGMWVSTLLTLLVVPSLHVSYLRRTQRKKALFSQADREPFSLGPFNPEGAT